MTSAPLDLFTKRRDPAGGFIPCDTFDTPHWKEQVAKSDKRFLVNDRAHPIVECIQIETAQEYAGSTNLVEYAPAFFARSMEYQDDRCPLLYSRGTLISFLQAVSSPRLKHRITVRFARPD